MAEVHFGWAAQEDDTSTNSASMRSNSYVHKYGRATEYNAQLVDFFAKHEPRDNKEAPHGRHASRRDTMRVQHKGLITHVRILETVNLANTQANEKQLQLVPQKTAFVDNKGRADFVDFLCAAAPTPPALPPPARALQSAAPTSAPCPRRALPPSLAAPSSCGSRLACRVRLSHAAYAPRSAAAATARPTST